MTEGVVDEIAERLLEAETVPVERHRAADDIELAPLRRRSGGEPSGHCLEECVGLERLHAERDPAAVELRENEEVVREATQPVDVHGGRVKLAGEVWSARTMDGSLVIEPGRTVDVLRIEGAVAVVFEIEH